MFRVILDNKTKENNIQENNPRILVSVTLIGFLLTVFLLVSVARNTKTAKLFEQKILFLVTTILAMNLANVYGGANFCGYIFESLISIFADSSQLQQLYLFTVLDT